MAVCKTLRAFPNGFHFRIQAHRIDNLHSGGRARGRLPRPPCAPSRPTKPHPFANDAQQKGEVRLRTRWPSAKTAVARRSRAKASCPPASQPSSAASAPHFSTPNFRPFPFRYLCPSVPICGSPPAALPEAPRHPTAPVNAPASWSAVALHRFSLPARSTANFSPISTFFAVAAPLTG